MEQRIALTASAIALVLPYAPSALLSFGRECPDCGLIWLLGTIVAILVAGLCSAVAFHLAVPEFAAARRLRTWPVTAGFAVHFLPLLVFLAVVVSRMLAGR